MTSLSVLGRMVPVMRGIVAAVMFFGLLAMGGTAASASGDESGIDGDTYESPTYGFALEWDGAVWSPNRPFELVNSGFFAQDRLLLDRIEGNEMLTRLWIDADAVPADDLTTCIAGRVNEWLSKDETLELAPLTSSDGSQVAGETAAGGVYAAYEGVFVNGLDEEFDGIIHFECRWIEAGESKLALTTLTTPGRYEADLALVEAVTDTIELAEERGR